MDSIEEKLEVARRELLDLGLRNPLINYRPLRARGITVADERPVELFRLLVTAGRIMYFMPAAGEERVAKGEERKESGDGVALHHLDFKLQTPHSAAELDKRLLNSYYIARTYMEEQGVNVLYLVLGMVRWYETDSSDTSRLAPLILIPVQLERANVYTRFGLRYSEEEIGENVSLRAKLQAEFGVKLPPFPDEESFDVAAYLTAVQQAIQAKSRWSVDSEAVALGFFSFGAFLMYHDLQPENWPADAAPAAHPILHALLGGHFDERPSRFSDELALDHYALPPHSHHVLDADSSQTAALLDVADGRNLVIQGPPGTGKSQTITNLIAQAIAQGKNVLFVAEKMAALEVVKRRLDQVGVGDACLELHSHKSNKKSVLQELRRTLELGRPKAHAGTFDPQLLATTQATLHRTSAALNTPIGESGLTPYQAFGELLRLDEQLQGINAPKLVIPGVGSWTAAQLRQRLEYAAELQTLLGRIGRPAHHPFWGSGRRAFAPADLRDLQGAIQVAQPAVLALQAAGAALTTHLGLPAGESRPVIEQHHLAAQRALNAPRLDGIPLGDSAWAGQSEAILAAVSAGARLAELHEQYDGRLRPEAWQQPLLPTHQALQTHGRQWWRWLLGPYRQARRELAALLHSDLPPTVDEQLALVDAILEAQQLRPVLAAQNSLLARLFAAHWPERADHWDGLLATAQWLVETHRLIQTGAIPAASLDYMSQVRSVDVSQPPAEAGTTNANQEWRTLRTLVGEVDKTLAAHQTAIAAVTTLLQLDETIRWPAGASLMSLPFTEQVALLAVWQAESQRLHEMVAWNHLADTLTAEGLSALLPVAANWPASHDCLAALARRASYEGLLAKGMQERPELAAFDGQLQQRRLQTFWEQDQQLFQANRVELADVHWQRLPRYTAGGQLGVLQREFEKKARHLPIRQLMERAGNAIQAIKPVFMMSPLSIAMFLPPGTVRFDLVVFDEASQVQPVDAFGAILRGRQVVVVGDSRQLPPTTFFTRLLQAEEDGESLTVEIESILSLFAGQGAPQRMLRWHYRSQHESLIAVSNQAFYDNRLVVFPSPDAGRKRLGLTCRHLPDAVYQRGGDRTNPREAEAVAEAVMAHARTHPDQTLGVAAFSVAQMQAILDRVEQLRRADPACEPFFNAHPAEPFFVKNLENVQGDERDVIFISIGYGRAADGSLLLNFGPLNQAGGERRLNVLITRARRRCQVFTNLTAEDIDPSQTDAPGLLALRRFLAYAQHGSLEEIGSNRGNSAGATFETIVAEALRQKGYAVQRRVGSAGFSLDLAVLDERQPGRYLLAIQGDGDSYFRNRFTRDRDRLRDQVLARLGWRVYRLWSADWFQNPQRELERLVAAIEAAKVGEERGTQGNLPSQDRGQELRGTQEVDELVNGLVVERQTAAPMNPADIALPPYQSAQLVITARSRSLSSRPIEQVAEWVKAVVEAESPVHQEEVVRRLVEATGRTRIDARARQAVEEAAVYAARTGLVQRQGAFFWKNGLGQLATARSRAALPAVSRRLEWVAPQETAAAIRFLVAGARGMRPDEIPAAVIRLLGCGRPTAESKSFVEQVLAQMTAEQQLMRQGDFLVTNNS
jgi:very-short-patch-repair endonuclease